MHNITTEADTTSFRAWLDIGDSWSLWNRYKFGWSFLAVTAVEVLVALFFSISRRSLPSARWLIAGIPFLLATIVDLFILYVMSSRDKRP